MDIWKLFDITHHFHTLMNPMSEDKIDELIQLLPFAEDDNVLDIGCGNGEILIQMYNEHKIKGTGVDLSPYALKKAKIRANTEVQNADISFVESDGKKFFEQLTNKFDHTMCIGASWIFGGHNKTLQSLIEITKKNGLIIVGEPFWIKEPSQWYLEKAKIDREEYATHAENVTIGEELGLRSIYAITSDSNDWDRYEHLKWLGVDNHLVHYPDDPDNEIIVEKAATGKEAYLNEGREVLGWAIYVFRKVD